MSRAFERSFKPATLVLMRRRGRSVYNRLTRQSRGQWARNAFFGSVGAAILVGLYFLFVRVLAYLEGVQLIGGLLTWKLTGMTLLTVFAMVAFSGMIIAMTTLFYSFDLKFLMQSPAPVRAVFLDKALETAIYSSWTLGLVILPYVFALGKVKGMDAGFYLFFALLFVPFLALGAAFGVGVSLALMYAFPSSKTRDVVWVASSMSLGLVYVLFRFSKPERLIRPDMLEVVAEYVRYLEAPTAEYLPSWWLTSAVMAYDGGNLARAAGFGVLLFASVAAVYGALTWVSKALYPAGYSGAQEGRRMHGPLRLAPYGERRAARFLGLPGPLASLFWKERLMFFRDVRHWSQMLLILALMMVYVISIRELPLDSPELRSLICFLNIGIAGAVVAALSLRFTFPSVSMEGRAWWIVRASPIDPESLMIQKLLFTLPPTVIVGGTLVSVSNWLLDVDAFIFWLSVSTTVLGCVTMCVMGVGLGAYFPQFNLPNIHQIESSAGGFLYMAACLGYLGLTIAFEAWPVKMYFYRQFGQPYEWHWGAVAFCAGAIVVLNFAAAAIPWAMGRRNLRTQEDL